MSMAVTKGITVFTIRSWAHDLKNGKRRRRQRDNSNSDEQTVAQRVERLSRIASLQTVHNSLGITYRFIEDRVHRSDFCERAEYLKLCDPNRG